jgi:hypothetical protein
MRPLSATVESVHPSWLWSGVIEPVVVRGWAYHTRLPVTLVRGELGGAPMRPIAMDIERDDVFDRYRETARRSANARRSGYLLSGLVGPVKSTASVDVSVVLATGEVEPAGAVELPVRGFPSDKLELSGSPEVVIAMATYDPPAELFEVQVESIRSQTHTGWSCIVCDDGSSQARRQDIRRVLGNDPRFVFVEHDERVGFYRNFERALALVPARVRYVALADQDDRWHPGKLAELVGRLDADDAMQLVASDARLVSTDGAVQSPTFYERRIPTHDDPYSLFVVNSLIGASMLFRRHLLDQALPFPRAFDDVYHDHWLARCALVRGTIGFVDEPLYDYVQHGGNVLGSRAAQRWPMRELVKPYLRCRLGGNDRRLPADWGAHFLTNVVEPQLAADLLRARWPAASELRWLDRIAADSSYREIAQILIDHRREARASRLRREDVELVLFAGRAWAMEHQPGDADVMTR